MFYTENTTLLSGGKINFEDLNMDVGYEPFKAYARSKLANILFTRELHKRLKGQLQYIYCFFPQSNGTNSMKDGKEFFFQNIYRYFSSQFCFKWEKYSPTLPCIHRRQNVFFLIFRLDKKLLCTHYFSYVNKCIPYKLSTEQSSNWDRYFF